MKRLTLVVTLLLFGLYACVSENAQDDVVPQQPAVPTGPSCPNSPTVVVSATQNSDCAATSGSVTVSGSGGSGGLTYSIDGQNFQADSIFSNLAGGSYTVIVKDTEGCTNTVGTTVSTNSSVSLTSDIMPIIASNCALSGCHVSGARSPDFTQKSNVLGTASDIKLRTENGSMPPSGNLSADELEKIKCWVDAGAQDN